jgi:iron complex outermembrane receptor protein
MGARNLMDVIQTVPGMNYYYTFGGTSTVYARGRPSTFSQRVLIMINSHPLNESFTGGATWAYDTLSLHNVERIEFIKGPGSAVYGTNAIAGVINVITKTADDIDGWELSTQGGSYDTQQHNILYGKRFSDLDVVFNYNYFNTHGFNGHLDKDALTSFDRIFGTSTSLAPRRLSGDDEKYDASLNMRYKGFTFDGKYVDRDRDLPVGLYPILNEKSTTSVKDYYLNLSYEKTIGEKVNLLGKAYSNYNSLSNDLQLYPPGAFILTPLGPTVRLQGMTTTNSVNNNRTGFEIQTTYTVGNDNVVVAGFIYEEMKQYDVDNQANFLFTSFPNMYVLLPSVRNLNNIQNINRSVKRNFKAFFAEDIWDIRDDLRLTMGLRYDDYSDFGDEVSPRTGLTWDFEKGHNLKVLYGHAFRAPSFFELYNVQFGNDDLDAEKVDTFEVSLGAQFNHSISGRVTWFRSRIRDSIIPQQAFPEQFLRYDNGSTRQMEGFVIEMKYDFRRETYLAMNYTYQLDKKRSVFFLPRLRGNIMANVRLSQYFNFYAHCHFEDGFRRSRGDNRDDMSGYGIINTTLIAKNFWKEYEGFEIRGSVYNLLDKDYTSPTGQGQLPGDLPRPGRNFIIEVKYTF